MNKLTKTATVLILTAALSGALTACGSQTNQADTKTMQSDTMSKDAAKPSTQNPTETMQSAQTDQNAMQGTQTSHDTQKAESYTDLANYQAHKDAYANQRVVFFFHAPWCSTCRALDKAITEKSANIPADVTIVKVDYDTNTQLRQKYGVTMQHTLVQLDKEGNKVALWSPMSPSALLSGLK